jgi:hypothetical protein
VGTLPEEDAPPPVDVDPSPVPARATELAAIIDSGEPGDYKIFSHKEDVG